LKDLRAFRRTKRIAVFLHLLGFPQVISEQVVYVRMNNPVFRSLQQDPCVHLSLAGDVTATWQSIAPIASYPSRALDAKPSDPGEATPQGDQRSLARRQHRNIFRVLIRVSSTVTAVIQVWCSSRNSSEHSCLTW